MKTTERPESKTLTVEQAGEILGIGRDLAYKLAKNGSLPGLIRLGTTYRVSREQLERVLAGAAENENAAA